MVGVISGRALGIIIEVQETHNHVVACPGHDRGVYGHVVDGVGGPVRMLLIFLC